METIYYICIGLTSGVIIGFLISGFKLLKGRKSYTEKQIQKTKKLINKAASVLKYVTFLLLALGLIWCSYFLILGVVMPGQADYANNMAELIVSVLTVISIIFAFVEFLKQKDKE